MLQARKSRLSGAERKQAYDYLVERDGEKCVKCGDSPPFVKLQVEHKDGNKFFHHAGNLQLMCGKCNSSKSPRGPGRKKAVEFARVRVCVSDKHPKPSTAEMERNIEGEPVFRDYVKELMRKNWRMEFNVVRDAGAEEAGVSVSTAERYLYKMTSISEKAWFTVVEDRRTKPYKKYLEWKDAKNPFRELRKKFTKE